MGKNFITVISRKSGATRAIGTVLGQQVRSGDVIALMGDLGTGKTTLTQGIAKGLSVPEEYYVTSPTFTLINEYPGRLILYHFDVYRLEGACDLEEMGYEEYFYGKGVVVIEWAEKLIDILPEEALYIHLTRISDEVRELSISCRPERALILKRVFEGGGYI